MIRRLLTIAIIYGGLLFLSSFSPSSAYACSACVQTNKYGSEVVSETNSATGSVNSASAAIASGFQSLIANIKIIFDKIISAIRALSSNVTTELERNATVFRKLMDEYDRQNEVRDQLRYVVESRQYYDENYGLDSLPVDVCKNYFDAINLSTVKELTADDLKESLQVFLDEYRTASPVDAWRYHERTLNNSDAAVSYLNQDTYTADELGAAVEWINQAIEPVPVSPVRDIEDPRALSSDDRKLLSEIETINLRLDAPKNALLDQVVLKAPIVGEGDSIQGILSKKVYEGIDPERIKDIGAGSQSLILRTLLQDMVVGNAIAFESLKERLNSGRVSAVNLAHASDKDRALLRFRGSIIDGEVQLEK